MPCRWRQAAAGRADRAPGHSAGFRRRPCDAVVLGSAPVPRHRAHGCRSNRRQGRHPVPNRPRAVGHRGVHAGARLPRHGRQTGAGLEGAGQMRRRQADTCSQLGQCHGPGGFVEQATGGDDQRVQLLARAWPHWRAASAGTKASGAGRFAIGKRPPARGAGPGSWAGRRCRSSARRRRNAHRRRHRARTAPASNGLHRA